MLITSGYNFEGYRITDYLGFFSGECALGTGFLSSFGAGIADLLGTYSAMYEEKLDDARDFALKKLMSEAKSAGANAIIAVDVEYTVFSADIVGVTANGTAVKIEKISDQNFLKDIQLNIKNFNPDIPIKPSCIKLTCSDNKCFAVLSIIDISANNITALSCDLKFTTIFEEEYLISDKAFYSFTKTSKERNSILTPIDLPFEIIPLLKSVHLIVKKYYDFNILVVATNNDVIWDSKLVESPNQNDPLSAKTNFTFALKSLASAKEIYEFCTEHNKTTELLIPPELMDIIKSFSLKERLYGNMYEECLKSINEYLNN